MPYRSYIIEERETEPFFLKWRVRVSLFYTGNAFGDCKPDPFKVTFDF